MSNIDIIIGLCKEYFNSNPDSSSYEIPKGVLGSKLNIGTTKTIAVCNALAEEYQFIKDNRGKLTINKQYFNAWLELQNNKRIQELKHEEITLHYSQLVNEIEQLKEYNEKGEKALLEKQNEKNKLENQIKELEKKKEELNNLEEEIKNIPDQIIELKSKIKKTREDNMKSNEELDRLKQENVKELIEFQEKQEIINNEKNKTITQMLNEENFKLRAEIKELKSQKSKSIFRRLI